MRVLCVSAFRPHARADNAGALDVHHMLRFLEQRHDVTVVCPPDEPLENGWRYAARSALSLPTRLPAIAFLNNDGELRAAIQAAASERFDVAHFAFTQTMHLQPLLPADIPAVIDEVDVAFERRRRFAETVRNPLVRYPILWDCAKLERYELRGLTRFDAVLVRTQREAELLTERARIGRVLVIPPWVDVSFRDAVGPQPGARDVLFFAALWRAVNDDAALWMAREVFPRVRARVPDARLLLVGSRPSAAVRALQSDAVEVPGYVESVAPYYQRAAVAVAPVRAGSGIRGKVLQALGVGRPVVSTPIGAEGIDATEDDGLFVRRDAEGFAEAVVELLVEAEAERWFQAGRRYFETNYRWEDGCRAWEALLLELASTGRSDGCGSP